MTPVHCGFRFFGSFAMIIFTVVFFVVSITANNIPQNGSTFNLPPVSKFKTSPSKKRILPLFNKKNFTFLPGISAPYAVPFGLRVAVVQVNNMNLIILSVTRANNLIYLEFRRQFTLFDRKLGFSVNAFRRFCEILIFKQRSIPFCSR